MFKMAEFSLFLQKFIKNCDKRLKDVLKDVLED